MQLNEAILSNNNKIELLSQCSSSSGGTLLNDKIESLEKQARDCNLILCDVPVSLNEALPSPIINLGKFLGLTLADDEFCAFRLIKENRNNKHPPAILIQFSRKAVKEKFFGAYLQRVSQKSFQL